MAIVRVIATNRLATSPFYAEIVAEYNERLKRDGRVNTRSFFKEVVSPRIPNYKENAFYKFIRKIKTAGGLAPVVGSGLDLPMTPEEEQIRNTLLSNQEATQRGVAYALNIGKKALEEILQNPTISVEKRVELLFKAMKAQDSRIHALGKMREDSREQAKFDHAFQDASADSIGE